MAIQLGSAFGKVSIDASGVRKGVSQAKADLEGLQKAAYQLGDNMARLGRNMTLGITLPIAAMGTAAIKMASDLEESRNKARVVFGDMSDSVLTWSKTAATAFGQSQQEALEAASTFGNLFSTMGLGADQTAAMSERLVELAGDLASFNNIDPTIALEKLRSGLVGEVEPLRTLGINLSAAEVKAKAMQMGLADASGELSQAALVQARYALILEQSTNAQGDFARTSGGMANQTRILRAQIKDLLAEMGDNLLPIALKLVQALNVLVGLLAKMPEPVQNLVLIFGALLAALGPMLWILGQMITFVTTLTTIFPGLAAALTSVGAAASTSVVPALGAIGAAIAAALPIILVVIAALTLMAVAYKVNFAFIRDNVRVHVAAIKLLWAGLLAFLRGDTATGMANVRAAWAVMMDELRARLEKYAPWLITAWNKLMSSLQSAASQAVRFVIAVFNIDWSRVGRMIIVGIINGFYSGISALLGLVRNTVQAVLNEMARVLQTGSPSKKTFQQGLWAGQGFAMGWGQGLDPNKIARLTAAPMTQSSHTQQYNTLQIGSGVTLQEVDRRIAVSAEEIMSTLASWLEGR